jgi:chromosome segregation ATPase
VQPSSETKEATINVVARKYKGRLFDRAEDNASQRVSSEREVITSADKKFIWRDEERVCDNLERLLNEYGKGPGHSPGRLRSAKKVLDEISRLKWEGKSELDQDRDLLLFVRKQGIATYGLNHKKSQLHSIYCTAELAYQERCRIEKEQKRSELKSKEEELKDVSASVERLSSRVDQFQRENVGMKKKIAELENKQRELVGKGASSKSEIERLNLEIEEKSQVLLALRRESVQLGMSAHSVHPIQFTKAEAAFVSDQLAKVDTIFAMDEKIERSMREVYEYNSESEFLAARNMALEKEITSDYDEIARNNGMPERLDTANINSLVDRVSRYEERLKRKASEIKASPEEIAAEKAVGAENSQISEVSPEDLHEEPLTDRRSHKPN